MLNSVFLARHLSLVTRHSSLAQHSLLLASLYNPPPDFDFTRETSELLIEPLAVTSIRLFFRVWLLHRRAHN
jgi:hypothetical protein